MSTNIWGAEEEYWTDIEETSDAEEETDEPLKPVPEWLQNFESKRTECEDSIFFGESPEFQHNDPSVLAVPDERIKPGEKDTRQVRKRWVVEDRCDVSDFDSLISKQDRPIQHPFEYDDFQKRAILHVQANEHVLVCAHTSAGKTAIAEYAIALAQKRELRAIYTSPIKALSNQKYREFSKLFNSVGIVTGDVSVNKEGGQCLIMTTEILRSLLYRNDPLIGQIGCVIFDEVHYINDEERGVVWEESIILLPSNIPLVMLSATVPNYLQFAQWIGVTKQREVFVTHTLHRPVPLKHHIFINKKSYLVMNEKGVFNSSAYNTIYSDMRNAAELKAQKAGAAGKAPVVKKQNLAPKGFEARLKSERQNLQEFFDYLQREEGLPVVVFTFSRKRCEQLAAGVRGPAIAASNKSRSKVFIKNSLAGLKEEDRNLPQIQMIQELAERGIGVHHGGLLPIVKEIVEIMFSTGMIQVLFATETFAMGVNMPARSVLLVSMKKIDGRSGLDRASTHHTKPSETPSAPPVVSSILENSASSPGAHRDPGRLRLLKGTEYIQMAGRAGRRGLDKEGNVYIFSPNNEPPPASDVHQVLTSKPHPLLSKFRLTLSMLLSLVTRQSIKPSDLISKSFLESRRAQELPMLQRNLLRARNELAAIPPVQCIFGDNPSIEEYVDAELICRELSTTIYTSLYHGKYRETIFCVGRVAYLHSLFDSHRITAYGGILGSEVTHDGKILFKMLVLLPSTCQTATCLYTVEGQGDLGQENLSFRDQAKIIEEAIRNGPGAYVPCDKYIVVSKVPIDCVSTLMNFIVEMPQFSWNIGQQDETEAPPIMFGGIPVKTKSKGKAKSVKKTDASVIDDQLNYMRAAVELNSALCGQELRPFTLSSKTKQLPIDQVLASAQHSEVATKLVSIKCHHCPEREKNMGIRLKQLELMEEIDRLLFMMSTDSLELMPDFDAKLAVLKQHLYVSDTNAITLKGRAACEMLTGDEIALTEGLFNHLFQNLSIPGIAAVISPFVFAEATCVEAPGLVIDDEETRFAIERIVEIHEEFGRDLAAKVEKFDEGCWSDLCNPTFAPLAYAWANGVAFAELVEKSSLHEGTIVRAIVRLDEMVKKMKNVCHIIGNMELKEKFLRVSEAIHRDILNEPGEREVGPVIIAVSIITELARLDDEYAKCCKEEENLFGALKRECQQLYQNTYGTDVLQMMTADLLERLTKFRDECCPLSVLRARTEALNKEMVTTLKEKEEQKKERARQEAVISLKRSRASLREVVAELARSTIKCLSDLTSIGSEKLLTSLQSEESLREAMDPGKLTLWSKSEDESNKHIKLIIDFRKCIERIAAAKTILNQGDSADWSEELDQFDDVNEDAEQIIKQGLLLCKIFLDARLQYALKQESQRIPDNLVALFGETGNAASLVKAIMEEKSGSDKVTRPPAPLAIISTQTNYFYDQMLTVTKAFKVDIDKYYHVIHGTEEKIFEKNESWQIFEFILNQHKEQAKHVCDDFNAEVLKYLLSVGQQTVKELHPLLHENLLIYANAISVQKSVQRISTRIDSSRDPLQWIDTHTLKNNLIKLISVYLQKAWDSAKSMDDCGIANEQPSALLTAQQHGSTLVDDIFYVVKENTHHNVDILDAYGAIVQETLMDIPEVLTAYALSALDIYGAIFFKPSETKFFTPVTVGDVYKLNTQGRSPGSSICSCKQSFPHALMSLRLIQQYAQQVEDQLNSPPATPSQLSSNPLIRIDLTAVTPESQKMSAYYQSRYISARNVFARKVYAALLYKKFFSDFSSLIEGEEHLIQFMDELHSYFVSIWPDDLAEEVSFSLLSCVIDGIRQCIMQKIAPADSPRPEQSMSMLSVFGSGKVDSPSSTDINVTFADALRYDCVVRHLMEWANDKLVQSDVRNQFLELLEICELLTVDSVTDILDLSASTNWHIDETMAVSILRARNDMSRYNQLDHVLNILLTSGVFKKS